MLDYTEVQHPSHNSHIIEITEVAVHSYNEPQVADDVPFKAGIGQVVGVRIVDKVVVDGASCGCIREVDELHCVHRYWVFDDGCLVILGLFCRDCSYFIFYIVFNITIYRIIVSLIFICFIKISTFYYG